MTLTGYVVRSSPRDGGRVEKHYLSAKAVAQAQQEIEEGYRKLPGPLQRQLGATLEEAAVRWAFRNECPEMRFSSYEPEDLPVVTARVLPPGWDRLLCESQSPADLKAFLRKLVETVYTREKDGWTFWGDADEAIPGRFLAVFEKEAKQRGWVPGPRCTATSWDSLSQGDIVAVLRHEVETTSPEPCRLPERAEFSGEQDLRGLDGWWMVKDPVSRLIRRVRSENGDTFLLGGEVYLHVGNIVFRRSESDQ